MGIMLMRHGLAGLPLMRSSTGSGLRQCALIAFARAALTRTYGFTPRILMASVNRTVMSKTLLVLATRRQPLGRAFHVLLPKQPPDRHFAARTDLHFQFVAPQESHSDQRIRVSFIDKDLPHLAVPDYLPSNTLKIHGLPSASLTRSTVCHRRPKAW